MKQLFLLMLAFVCSLAGTAQHETAAEQDTSWKTVYRETAPLVNTLVHTRLNVRFDFDKAYLYGQARITLKPHFYPTDSLVLDAKGMDIKNVSLVQKNTLKPLSYRYDSMQLHIQLGKTYTRQENYTVYIDYVSKPNELRTKGSAAITDAKGLYFINPKGEDKEKPTQIWTQGETEATSVWCPTIDRPNQKTTQEIAMRVPSKYVTLSNGKLTSQVKHSDGTRTDTWKMDLPHAPYLFFMGVGDFAIVKDQYKGKEVSYYVEKEYAPVARKIFGNTPEMMRFFSRVLGMEYPWNKYAQMVGRDYVSGAMENTTAVLHQESAQQDARELVDGNIWENTIAHELFHHWFGDLVTMESWSNLTLNESFANYSEYLWQEYKYGNDAADEHLYSDMTGYVHSQNEKKDLVRFYYPDKESMFDAVSYNKGGAILHMLRKHVGDSAFFKALNLFLERHKFGTAEAHDLRIAFEKVTGRDMNWFWNQWYFGSGHPELNIDYTYDDQAGKVQVTVTQEQSGQIFRLPLSVDIYHGKNKVRHTVWLTNKKDVFSFSYTSRPDLVNVDADRTLVGTKTDNKTLHNYIHQYRYAGKYLDRREAIDFAAASDDPQALELLKTALDDPYHGLRAYTIGKLDIRKENIRTTAEPLLAGIAAKDPKSIVKARAISALGTYDNEQYRELFVKHLQDSSYSVAGAALEALMSLDGGAALDAAKKMSTRPAKGKLLEAITRVLVSAGDESGYDLVVKTFGSLPLSQAKFNLLHPLADMLGSINDTEKVKKGIDLIAEFRDAIPEGIGAGPYINKMLSDIVLRKQKNPDQDKVKDQIEYIRSRITE